MLIVSGLVGDGKFEYPAEMGTLLNMTLRKFWSRSASAGESRLYASVGLSSSQRAPVTVGVQVP